MVARAPVIQYFCGAKIADELAAPNPKKKKKKGHLHMTMRVVQLGAKLVTACPNHSWGSDFLSDPQVKTCPAGGCQCHRTRCQIIRGMPFKTLTNACLG